MRDIKFRGQRQSDNEWIYGDLLQPTELCNIYEISDCESIDGSRYDVIEDTVGQYTGIKDENDIEIFEGDIIDFSYDMFVGNFNTFVAKGIVVFEEGAFYVQCLENERLTKDESYLLYTINIDTIEVIGNIYDNPELLKEEG